MTQEKQMTAASNELLWVIVRASNDPQRMHQNLSLPKSQCTNAKCGWNAKCSRGI